MSHRGPRRNGACPGVRPSRMSSGKAWPWVPHLTRSQGSGFIGSGSGIYRLYG